MAYCKMWDVEKKTAGEVIQYISAEWKCTYTKKEYDLEGKTEVTCEYLVSGINTELWSAAADFESTKTRWQNKSNKSCYHGIQSFLPGEVTPELAHKIGKKMAAELWGERFEVIIATHLNEKHIHNHFAINNISFVDGKQFRDNRKSLALMRRVSDRICMENGVSVITSKNYVGVDYVEWKKQINEDGEMMHSACVNDAASQIGTRKIDNSRNREYTRKYMVRIAVNKAIELSYSLSDFEKNLKAMGYTVDLNPNHKYWTIKENSWDRPMRMWRLGENYTNDRICERIKSPKRYASQFGTRKKVYKVKGVLSRKRSYKGYKAIYIRYCYILGIKPYNHKKLENAILRSPAHREALRNLNRVSEQTYLCHKYDINNTQDLERVEKQLEDRINFLLKERKILYKKGTKQDIEQLNSELRIARGERQAARGMNVTVEKIKKMKKIPESQIGTQVKMEVKEVEMEADINMDAHD